MSTDNRFADAEDVEALIYQAVGAGSACWERLDRAGTFDSDAARSIAQDALARLGELLELEAQL